MVEGSQHHIVADKCPIPDENAALVLKLAPHVDKDIFANVDILSAVGVKGREKPEALIHRPAGQFGKQRPQLSRLMVAPIDLRGNPQSLLADAVHELVGLASAVHRLAAVQML